MSPLDIKWINSICGSCASCDSDDQRSCANAQFSGYTRDGTFQQYVVCKELCAVRIPLEAPLDKIAPVSHLNFFYLNFQLKQTWRDSHGLNIDSLRWGNCLSRSSRDRRPAGSDCWYDIVYFVLTLSIITIQVHC
jgi:hypothetical protein